MKYSISDTFTKEEISGDWQTFWFALSNFLDDFYRNPSADRLETEPEFITDRISSFLAGTAEELAYRYSLPIPKWVFRTKYHLDEPFFVGGFKGEYNIFLLRETPAAFKVRNIFCGENVLDRC